MEAVEIRVFHEELKAQKLSRSLILKIELRRRQRTDLRHGVWLDHHRDAETSQMKSCWRICSSGELEKPDLRSNCWSPCLSRTRPKTYTQLKRMMTRRSQQNTRIQHCSAPDEHGDRLNPLVPALRGKGKGKTKRKLQWRLQRSMFQRAGLQLQAWSDWENPRDADPAIRMISNANPAIRIVTKEEPAIQSDWQTALFHIFNMEHVTNMRHVFAGILLHLP